MDSIPNRPQQKPKNSWFIKEKQGKEKSNCLQKGEKETEIQQF